MARISTIAATFALGALTLQPALAAQRVFVASYGNDANTASNCAFANPCRGFTAAMTVVDPGGEVVALDAAGYGAVTITKSVTITANPGFYAGISASAGDAVTINTASVNVTLRGLNINGIGATNGVVMSNGNRLSVENCVVSNFSGGSGIKVDTAARLRVADSIVRENFDGVRLQAGASGDVVNTKVLGNTGYGVVAEGTAAGTTTSVVISDSLISGNQFGALSRALGADTANTYASVVRSTISNSSISGVVAVNNGAGTATSVLTIANSLVSRNLYGLVQGGTATLESLGNNAVRQNSLSDTLGTITVVSGT